MKKRRRKRRVKTSKQVEALSMPQTTPGKQERHVSFWRKIPNWFWAVLVFFSILITVAEGYPWLSIQDGPLLNPTNPYSELFNISNGGYVPITNLTARCLVTFKSPGVEFQNDFIFPNFSRYLSHASTATVPCFRAVGVSQVASGSTLSVEISYAIFHLNIPILRRRQLFYFISVTASDGSTHWTFST